MLSQHQGLSAVSWDSCKTKQNNKWKQNHTQAWWCIPILSILGVQWQELKNRAGVGGCPWDLLASQSSVLVRLQLVKDPISKTKVDGAEEMALGLSVFAALVED